jgi:tetratricopeptide (TPR) repeat protein
MKGRGSVVLAALLATLGHATARAAGPTATERGVAEQLFIDGKRLMADGRFDEACPKLAESHRLDPGGGTVLNLAVCHETQGRYASAWSEYHEAIDLARTDGRRDREQLALERLIKIEPKVSRVTIHVDRAADIPGLVLTLDGESINRVAWGTPLPVDAGMHEIVATAPGKLERRATVQIGNTADNKAVTLASLEDAPPSPPPSAAAPPLPSPPSPPSRTVWRSTVPALPPAPESSSGTRPVGFLVGGLGVVALGAGAVFGVEALLKRQESDAYCKGNICSRQEGVDLNDDATRFANYANVGIGVGILGVALGTYLVLRNNGPSAAASSTARLYAPNGIRVLPAMSARDASVRLSGTW